MRRQPPRRVPKEPVPLALFWGFSVAKYGLFGGPFVNMDRPHNGEHINSVILANLDYSHGRLRVRGRSANGPPMPLGRLRTPHYGSRPGCARVALRRHESLGLRDGTA